MSVKFSSILDEITAVIPKYRKMIFKVIITGMLIGESSKCVAGIYRLFELLMKSNSISRKCFYGFLKSSKIPFEKIWGIVFRLLGGKVLTSGRLLIALDDTTYGKTGKKIDGCDVHYDHAAKINSSKYVYGHCRVVLGIQMLIHGRWACLPVKNALYRLKKSVEKVDFKTKIEIAAQLVNELLQMLSYPALIVTDSWFGNKSLVKALGGKYLKTAHVLTRLRIDCNLYDFPVPVPKGKRGRKPVYGKRLPKLPNYVKNLEKLKDIFFIYGKNRECTYSEFCCMHKNFKCKVKVVIVHYKTGWFFPIVSTDTSLTAKQMVEYYSARWKIESGFKELKHEVGIIDTQARKKPSVENHFELCCIAMNVAWIYAMKQAKAPERKYKTSKANAYAFADIRRKIRNEFYEGFNFNEICSSGGKSIKNFILNAVFECVA